MKTDLIGAMMKVHVVYMFAKKNEEGEDGSGWGTDERLMDPRTQSFKQLAEDLKAEHEYDNVLIFNVIPIGMVGGTPIITGVHK